MPPEAELHEREIPRLAAFVKRLGRKVPRGPVTNPVGGFACEIFGKRVKAAVVGGHNQGRGCDGFLSPCQQVTLAHPMAVPTRNPRAGGAIRGLHRDRG